MFARETSETVSKLLGQAIAQVQDHLAQANYYRDAANLGEYRSGAHFLPYINNEACS